MSKKTISTKSKSPKAKNKSQATTQPQIEVIDQITETTTSEPPKNEFLPVLLNGEKTLLPISTVMNAVEYDFTRSDPDHPNHFAVIQGSGKSQTVYYVNPRDFDEMVIGPYGIPTKLSDLNHQAEVQLRELKIAWIKFGTTILAVNIYRTYRQEFKTFDEYCEQKLQLHRGTVYEIMSSTLFLMKYQPELYRQLMSDQIKSIPSYRSLYLLSKKQRYFKDKKIFNELLDAVVSGKLSTRNLQAKLQELFQPKEPTEQLSEAIKKYTASCRELIEIIPENHQLIIKIDALLKEIQDLRP